MGDQERPDRPQVDDLLDATDMQREGNDRCYVSPAAEEAAKAQVSGETDFEPQDLEAMLAMVENSNPADLEAAGQDLWTAAGKIKDIGEEIKTHVDNLDWDGEFGEAFRTWGRNLGKNTVILGEYTEQASKQLAAAGEGLSQVKSAMPKPDASYANAPRLESIPSPAKVDTNPTYAAAKKKEDDRQDAIQQMNRLTSYYRVTRDNMGTKPEPHFGPMPPVGFPPPPPGYVPIEHGSTGGSSSSLPSGPGTVHGGSSTNPGSTSFLPSTGSVATPNGPVETELNSAPPPVMPIDRAPAPSLSPPALQTQVPISDGAPPAPGPSHQRVSPKVPPGKVVTQGPQGLPPRTSTGQAPQPRSTNPGAPPGRHTGILGGKPQPSGQNPPPRIPRGTVVGGEHGLAGRPPMGMGSGTGASGAAAGGSAGRRLASTPGGIVGSRSIPGSGVVGRPFTPGGTGLAGSSGQKRPGERSREDDEGRPDYLTEDEETWTRGRSDSTPPVVE